MDFLAKRVILFEDSWPGKRVQKGGNVRVIRRILTWTECAANCNREPKCRSFSICNKLACELNSEDRFSTEQAEEILTDDVNCIYFGMQKTETPICIENGSPKDIRLDSTPGKCAINEKRVDVEWGQWSSQIDVNTTTELKLVETRNIMVESAHGGIKYNESKRIVYWFRRVYETKTWSDAIQKCESIGGRLFTDVDGTTHQLDLMIDNIPTGFYWLGLSKDPTNVSVLRDLDGNVVDNNLLIWCPHEPSGFHKETIVAVYAINNILQKYLHDYDYDAQLEFICDMK